MNKAASIILTLSLVVVLGIVFIGGSKLDKTTVINQPVNNVEIRDGVQYITITAKGGYSPQNSTAKAGIPTRLVMKTNRTFDCSSSLAIRSIGYQKILPQNGEEVIDIGIPKAGEPLQGICSMGMYNFSINFT